MSKKAQVRIVVSGNNKWMWPTSQATLSVFSIYTQPFYYHTRRKQPNSEGKKISMGLMRKVRGTKKAKKKKKKKKAILKMDQRMKQVGKERMLKLVVLLLVLGLFRYENLMYLMLKHINLFYLCPYQHCPFIYILNHIH